MFFYFEKSIHQYLKVLGVPKIHFSPNNFLLAGVLRFTP